MKTRKRSVTLTELLIGCILLSSLLALLFGLLREVKIGEKKIREEKDLVSEEFRLESRLDQLFLKITPLKQEHPGFYTDENLELIFTTLIGPNLDSPFFDRVLCALYCNENGELILDTWPDPIKYGVEPVEMRREVLLKGVTALEWKFFSPPKRGMVVDPPSVGNNEDKQDPPSREWLSIWKVGYQKIPPFLKLTIRRKNGDISYETYLPATDFPLELPE